MINNATAPMINNNHMMYNNQSMNNPMMNNNQMMNNPMMHNNQMMNNPMMNIGFNPHGNFPPQILPTQDFLIQNDFYREGNIDAFFTSDYILALRNAKSAFIKQKVELFEVLTGCETKNRYSVFLRYDNGINALLFKCKEESSWCSRNCLS
jgi:hypothetical protein